MNDELLVYFLFFLLRDALPVGVICEALQNAEAILKCDKVTGDTAVAQDILFIAHTIADRFQNAGLV